MSLGEITIEGRALKPVKNGTFEHDIYSMQVVQRSGLSMLQLAEGEDQDSFINRLALKAWESGAAIDILAAMLIPAELAPDKWTPDDARTLAEFLRGVTDPDSKRELRMRIGAILYGFFVNALSLSKTSTRSSTLPSGGAPGATEGVPTMATGA